MTKPIPGKAEIALEYPDKLYVGTFEHTARFDTHLDASGISLSLHHGGTDDVRKTVRMHFHYALFAEILRDLAKTAACLPATDIAHREALRDAAAVLSSALGGSTPGSNGEAGVADLTPDEEVRLLHIME
jgi:hypothetical protein